MHGRTRYGTDGKGIPLPNHTQHPPNQNNNTMDFLKNDFFLLTLTFGVFLAAKTLQKKTGSTLLNPILISIALLIGYLKLTDISYGEYNKSAHLIEFWLKPAVVALGVPLYRQLSTIRKQIVPLVVSSLVGCISGIVSVVIVARMCGASHDVAITGTQIGHHTHCHGSVAQHWRHPFTDGRSSRRCRNIRRHARFQDIAGGPCAQPHSPRIIHGHRIACRGHKQGHGSGHTLRGLFEPRTDTQRHFHSHLHTVGAETDGNDIETTAKEQSDGLRRFFTPHIIICPVTASVSIKFRIFADYIYIWYYGEIYR